MVRVDGRQSDAIVVTVETEVEGTLGMLFIDLDAPVSELEQWSTRRRLQIEARWEPKFILFPIHATLIAILGSCSVHDSFVAHTHVRHDRLFILLQSTGALKPLHDR